MNESAFELSHLKKTKSRVLIYNILQESSFPLTVEDISNKIKDSSIDLSTIYRTLTTFEKHQLIKKEVNNQKENVYSLLSNKDEHVLVCKICHRRITLNECPYHEVNKKIEEKTGFLIQDQNIEIYGVCPQCQKKK